MSFRGGRVSSWEDSGYPKLKTKMLPSKEVQAGDYFTVGSTKDEVLAVQGSPTKFTDSTLTYGLSHVSFRGGRVSSWEDSGYPKLKAKMVSAKSQ